MYDETEQLLAITHLLSITLAKSWVTIVLLDLYSVANFPSLFWLDKQNLTYFDYFIPAKRFLIIFNHFFSGIHSFQV
jgi:hypothetical protein